MKDLRNNKKKKRKRSGVGW